MSPKNNSNELLQQASGLYQSGQLAEAARLYKKLLKRFPTDPDLLTDLGTILLRMGNTEEGFKLLERSKKIAPHKPQAFFNYAVGLQKLNRFAEALANYDRVIVLDPHDVEAYSGRGNALEHLKRFDEAMATYDRAIAINPDSAEAYWNKALLNLLLGNFEEGWKLYEWRRNGFHQDFVRNHPQPLWLGEHSLAGKTLLIYAEQGLGDFIQFCRYIPRLEASRARVVLEMPASLVPLISTLKAHCTVIEQGKPLPAYDFHCPVLSLPLACKTSMQSIPAEIPYLYADPDKQSKWHLRLGNQTVPRVGLVWSGAENHRNDHNRSIPFEFLEPLWQLPIEFHVLQKEIRPHDFARLTKIEQVHTHREELLDFSDTAALVQEMNLVISVDTSVMHLAGALGQTVWMLLPYMPDYRWMLDRSDTPWYPTATLFRQPAIGDWASVISEIVERLRAMTFETAL